MGEQKWNGKTASMIAHDKVWAGDKWTHPSVEALISRVAAMEEALREAIKTCQCRGTGTWTTSCTLCGDSTFDHYCNDENVPCDRPWCVAARAALAKSALEGGAAMASDTLDLIGRLNDAFKSVAVCHCGNGIIDGCCDNHTPSWNPCPDSQLLHDAMNRLTALEAALKAALAECEAWREHKGLGSPCSLLDYPIRKAMSETDRLRKECAL